MPSTRRALLRFVLASLVVALAASLGGAIISRRAATDSAIADARRLTSTLAKSAVETRLPPAILSTDPSDPARVRVIRRLDDVFLKRQVDPALVRVKLWTEDGRVVYSDAHELIGQRFPLGDDELEVLRSGTVDAELSDLDKPENRYERGQGKLLEVYTPVKTEDGKTTLLFETYSRYSSVSARAGDIWRSFVPIGLGALLLLQLVQLPLAWSTARRLDRSLAERERLMRRAVEASDAERQRIARDLHDGVVQDLAATSYALAGASDAAARAGDPEQEATLRGASLVVRSAIRSLRTLLVEIYPPSLHRSGLPTALRDLVTPLAGRGVAVEFEVDESLSVPPETSEVVFRVAQEALRNVVKHAAPTRVRLALTSSDDRLVLEVADDGAGFDASAVANEGHVGLVLLHDLARSADGTLEIISAPREGTRVVLEVPLP